ncbi:zinc finger protein 724 [Teleopsis dalmanni]|uniref:zinc finger protein 724 n=1 Tax=Teleopsis dalmanni TaxID=139649 RepID=UPI0018CF8A58|nr:zinc finger protein 724 [Teleopsis dalmanni]
MFQSVPTLHQPLHSKVSNYLNDQRRTGQYCDLIIALSDTEHFVFAHYCVVGAQSRYVGGPHLIQKLLQFSIHNPLKIIINDFKCAQCLQTMVDFFYEDIVSIATEHEMHFKTLANRLEVTELLSLYQSKGEEHCEGMGNSAIVEVNETINAAALENKDVKADINMATNTILNEERTYFKLRNPHNTSANNKMNNCMACEFKCYNVKDMIAHMHCCEASHLTCSLCEVGFTAWREYELHLRKHSSDLKKPFFCLECDARFVTRTSLFVHFPKHSTETPHQCTHCDKAFKWKHGLRDHLLSHNKEKQMLCDVCGFSTTNMKALKSHKLLHTGEFFKCPFTDCKHSTNRKENLKLHIETHKQERPFVCEICGCKFSQNKNLKRHAIKHSATETNKYKCQLCSFASHRSDKVKEHTQRMHTEKAVVLELSEVVENSFENQTDDTFQLLPIQLLTTKHNIEEKMKPQKNKKKFIKKVPETIEVTKSIRNILPKTTVDDVSILPATLLNIETYEDIAVIESI